MQSWNHYVSYYNEAADDSEVDISSQLEDSAFMFDAAWAVALALNNTNADLVNFTYDSEDSANISQTIYQRMLNLEFFGLTVSYILSYIVWYSTSFMCPIALLKCL